MCGCEQNINQYIYILFKNVGPRGAAKHIYILCVYIYIMCKHVYTYKYIYKYVYIYKYIYI